MNLSSTIIPKSDQLNADDLLAAPRTIRITSVDAGSAEQPVTIHYEGENGRPYKPCKSMRRVLVAMWGSDGSVYPGRSLTLYCDPSVKFGGETTGGIRISHASDLAETMTIPLTVTRGKRKPYTVQVLAKAAEVKPARPLEELVAAGDAIAAQGLESLKGWWQKTLTAAERELLGGNAGARMTAWKKTAEGTAS
jgi:hypothetical protein